MRVYHGSYIEIREPLVHVGRKSLDFGQGFYVTNIKEQALGQLRFAKPTHQMCIHKQEILDKYLKYIESIKI